MVYGRLNNPLCFMEAAHGETFQCCHPHALLIDDVRLCVCCRLRTSGTVSIKLMRMCLKSKRFSLSSCRLPHQIRVRSQLVFLHLLIFLFSTNVVIHALSLFPETQDDLEAITNDIKKMANNARNKLKSESVCLTHTHTHT